MKSDMSDQVILVTGPAGNLGTSVVKKFSSEGARLILIDHHPDRLFNLYPELVENDRHLLITDIDLTDNTTLSDLVADLNTRLAAAGLTSLVARTGTDVNGTVVGDKISIGGVDPSVLRLQLTGGELLGFEAAQTAAIPNAVQAAELSVDPDTGVISVDRELFDAETTQSYSLQATVTDIWGGDEFDLDLDVEIRSTAPTPIPATTNQ